MPTCNGAPFLHRQLQSLMAQTERDWRIIARDDGSVDGTWDILRDFAGSHPDRVHVLTDSRHVGLCTGVSELMEASRAEYIMFCDQDDVWMPNKIEKTLEGMKRLEAEKGRTAPLLVHSDLMVVDKDLVPICDSFWSYQGIVPENAGRFNRQLIANTVTGCAMMINRPLLVLAMPIPGMALVHDWWIAQVAAAFGTIACVREPLIAYRQHGKNQIGAKGYSVANFMKRIWNYATSKEERGRVNNLAARSRLQVLAFRERYASKLNVRQAAILAGYLRLCAAPPLLRFFIMAQFGFWRPGLLRNITMGMKYRFSG